MVILYIIIHTHVSMNIFFENFADFEVFDQPRKFYPRNICSMFDLSLYMLNKNSLAVKKVRGQSEATMAISDQNL